MGCVFLARHTVYLDAFRQLITRCPPPPPRLAPHVDAARTHRSGPLPPPRSPPLRRRQRLLPAVLDAVRLPRPVRDNGAVCWVCTGASDPTQGRARCISGIVGCVRANCRDRHRRAGRWLWSCTGLNFWLVVPRHFWSLFLLVRRRVLPNEWRRFWSRFLLVRRRRRRRNGGSRARFGGSRVSIFGGAQMSKSTSIRRNLAVVSETKLDDAFSAKQKSPILFFFGGITYT